MPTSLLKCSDIINVLREFFLSRGFIEVETSVNIPSPVPEPHLDLFKTENGFLRPSPEIEMKILLAEGAEKIFQIGPCFRKGEIGRLHLEKFTMLEWYEVNADYNDLIDFTKKMMLFLTEKLFNSNPSGNHSIDFSGEWDILTVHEAFAEFADISPEEAIKQGKFEEILVEKIEPQLSRKRPVILKDYPAELAALAKLNKNDISISERWELYLAGIEIANTYTELVDPQENRLRFAEFAEKRKILKKNKIPLNENFFKILEEKGLPECSGCALGVDRLTMIMNGMNDIRDKGLHKNKLVDYAKRLG